MLKSWRIWDGVSAFAGNPYATPGALKKTYNLDSTKKLVVYMGDNGMENMVHVYEANISVETIQADFDAEVSREKAYEEEAKKPKPTVEGMQKQLSAMALVQAQTAKTVSDLQQSNATLMLKLARGNE